MYLLYVHVCMGLCVQIYLLWTALDGIPLPLHLLHGSESYTLLGSVCAYMYIYGYGQVTLFESLPLTNPHFQHLKSYS